MASTEKTCGTGLMAGLLGDILGRLPFSSLLSSRCVCRAWRLVVDEPSFRSSYRDSARFFCESNCIQDSSGKVMRWAPHSENVPDRLCAVAQNRRLALARSTQVRKVFVGDPFATNIWEEIPYLAFGDMTRAFLILDSLKQQYKVVVWFSEGDIYSFTSGQAEWCHFRADVRCLQAPVLIQNKLVCMECSIAHFVQFDVESNTITYVQLRNVLVKDGEWVCLGSWRGKLYMVYLNMENRCNFAIEEVYVETGDPIRVVSTYSVPRRPDITLTFCGQADSNLNFAGRGGRPGTDKSFSYDLDADSWIEEICKPSSVPLDVRLEYIGQYCNDSVINQSECSNSVEQNL